MTHAQLSPLLKLLKSPACRLYNEAGCQTFPLKYLGFGILKLGLTASAWVEALHVGCCAPDGDGQRPSRAFPATALSQGKKWDHRGHLFGPSPWPRAGSTRNNLPWHLPLAPVLSLVPLPRTAKSALSIIPPVMGRTHKSSKVMPPPFDWVGKAVTASPATCWQVCPGHLFIEKLMERSLQPSPGWWAPPHSTFTEVCGPCCRDFRGVFSQAWPRLCCVRISILLFHWLC